jgi:hypothetical protein
MRLSDRIMNKAAGLLNTTQPAVSKSIAELERALACVCSTVALKVWSRLPTVARSPPRGQVFGECR